MSETITTDFTAAEVLEALEDHLENGDGWGEYEVYIPAANPVDPGSFAPLKITLRGVEYEVKEVDRTGGMDEGSGLSSTIQVGSQFFRKSGYYASHYGSDWDGDFREVRPVTKTVTVYEG